MPTSNHVPRVLIPEKTLRRRIEELGQEISTDYADKEIVAVCILKGSFVFYADIIRQIDIPMTCEYLGISSYGNDTETSGEVKLTLDIHEPIKNKHVIVFEDLVDTGLSLQYISGILNARQPASLKTCSLLLKNGCQKLDIAPDYLGFKVENDFVVGYGIDCAGQYRNLPYIGAVDV